MAAPPGFGHFIGPRPRGFSAGGFFLLIWRPLRPCVFVVGFPCSMHVRFAKLSDASELAEIHAAAALSLSDTLIPSLGKGFLRCYYRVLLSEPHSIVLCAVQEDGRISGFASGSTSSLEHARAIKQNNLRLAWSCLPSLIRRPRLSFSLRIRAAKIGSNYSAGEAHAFFWAWREGDGPAGGAMFLFEQWLAAARLCGAQDIFMDVEKQNTKVLAIHRAMGAEIVGGAGNDSTGWKVIYRAVKAK